MALFEIEAPNGMTLEVEGETPPNEVESMQIFRDAGVEAGVEAEPTSTPEAREKTQADADGEDDPLTGELGIIENEDGTQSTEKSIALEVDGRYYNIPMLVKGQIDPEGLASGKPPTDEQVDIAYGRFDARGGFHKTQPYESPEEAEQAAKARSNSGGSLDKFKKNPEPPESSIMDDIFGVIETGASIASSAVAEGVAGVAGLGALATGQTSEKAEGVINKTREALTFEPKTDEGKSNVQSVGEFLEPVGKFFKKAENFSAEKAFELTGSPAIASLASTLPALMSEIVGVGVAKGVLGIKNIAQKAARNRKITKLIEKHAPSSETLFSEANKIFKEADADGIFLNQKPFVSLVNDLAEKIRAKGASPETAKANQAIKTLKEFVGKDVRLSDLDRGREVAMGAKISADPHTAKLGKIIVSGIDDFINNVDIGLLSRVDGNPVSVKSLRRIQSARAMWGRGRRSQLVNGAFERAKRSSGGLDPGLANEFRKILGSDKKRAFFNKAEIEAMDKVILTGKVEGAARLAGQLGFSSSSRSSAFGAGAGGVIGLGVFGPTGAVAIPLIGTVSRRLAKRMLTNNGKGADAIIRAGSNARKITSDYLDLAKNGTKSPSELSELLLLNEADLSTLPKSKFTDAAKKITRERREAIGATLGKPESSVRAEIVGIDTFEAPTPVQRTAPTPAQRTAPTPAQPTNTPVEKLGLNRKVDSSTKIFRGYGRTDIDDLVSGQAGPVFGREGKYFSFDKENVSKFGPKTETVNLSESIKSPLVIKNKADFIAFAKRAGLPINPSDLRYITSGGEMKFNPNFKQDFKNKFSGKIAPYLRANGKDSIIIDFDPLADIDISTGISTKPLRKLFDEPQVFILDKKKKKGN